MTGGAQVIGVTEAGARLECSVQRVDTGFASRLDLFVTPRIPRQLHHAELHESVAVERHRILRSLPTAGISLDALERSSVGSEEGLLGAVAHRDDRAAVEGLGEKWGGDAYQPERQSYDDRQDRDTAADNGEKVLHRTRLAWHKSSWPDFTLTFSWAAQQRFGVRH